MQTNNNSHQDEFSRLLAVSKLIVSELDIERVFDLVVNSAQEIVNAELVLVPMLNEERDRYTYVAAAGKDADEVRGASFSTNVGMCGWVLKHERSLLFGETSTQWMDEMTQWEDGQQSAVLVPLIGRKGIIGGLSALGKKGGSPFTQHDLDLLTMFANHVSIAIENAYLFDERLRFEQGLQDVNDCFLLFSTNPLENIKAITDTTAKVLQAVCAMYNRKDGDLLHTLAGWHVPPDMPLSDKGDGHLCFDVIAKGDDKPFVVRNLQNTRYAESDPKVMKYGLEAYVGYAVKSANKAVGSLCAVFQTDTPLSSYQLSLLQVLGKAASIEEERMSAEAVLRSSENRFRSIIENSPVGIIVAEQKTGSFRYVNPVICKMLGYSSSELLQMDIRAIHPVSELRLIEESFAFHDNVQTYCKRSDGRLFPVDIYGITMELEGIACRVGFFSDMTERHLLNEERLKTQKLEAIGKLAGGIAHDFNNLLQGVFGYISMAKMVCDNKERSVAMLEQAEKALRMSVNLTKQLLTFSKGGQPVKKIMSLQPIIENSVRFALSGSNIDHKITIDKDLWNVEADEGQIGQVIQNIVLNAAQAMPMGGTVEITAKNLIKSGKTIPQLPNEGMYVEIAIKDSGIGISEEYLPKIFDPYFTTKKKGSGLGLTSCYSIITNHAGVINVSSKVGKGTTFYVYLPAVNRSQEAAQVSESTPVARKGRILLMDDEELIRDIAGEMIIALDHEIELAENGEKAIRKYRESLDEGKPFDIVILDMTIRRGMGGKETLERLLALNPKIKTIVSSGYSDDDTLANCLDYGFSACLSKPYKLEKLRDTLNKLLTS